MIVRRRAPSAPLLCRKSSPDGKNGNEDNCTANNDVSSGHDIFLIEVPGVLPDQPASGRPTQ